MAQNKKKSKAKGKGKQPPVKKAGKAAKKSSATATAAAAVDATPAIVEAGAALLVPEGVSAEDAAFFPAVETALSLVQDANPVVVERKQVELFQAGSSTEDTKAKLHALPKMGSSQNKRSLENGPARSKAKAAKAEEKAARQAAHRMHGCEER